MRARCLRGWALILGGLAGASASAQTTINIFQERQQERKSARWTLADWLDQKKKISEQNFWLARHTNKVPVEVALTLEGGKSSYGTELDLYVAWLGLRLGYARDTASAETAGGALQLRAFGGNLQNTNLIVRLAYEYDRVRSFEAPLQGNYAGWSAGGELQIYFAEWLGIRGDYLHRLSRQGPSDARLSGSDWSAVAFLEMSFLRLEGGWEAQTRNFVSEANAELNGPRAKSGLIGRARVFF